MAAAARAAVSAIQLMSGLRRQAAETSRRQKRFSTLFAPSGKASILCFTATCVISLLRTDVLRPEASGVGDPSLGARTDAEPEAVTDAGIPVIRHVRPRPPQRL